MCAEVVDKGWIVSVAKGQGGIGAACFRCSPEISSGACEIADIDHLLTVRHEIGNAVALVGAENERGPRIRGNIDPGRGARQYRAVGRHEFDAQIDLAVVRLAVSRLGQTKP